MTQIRIIKYALVASMFVGLLAVKAGVMTGEANYILPIAVTEPGTIASTELFNATPVQTKRIKASVTITAYSSRPEETDDTPFITASGKWVRDGIVAANWLPLGAKVKIPALFGDKIFVVEDRMHKRNSEKLDIWFASTSAAIKFGVKKADVEII